MGRVLMVFTGGTISMQQADGGNRPMLRAADLLGHVPNLGGLAEVEVVDWGLVPGSHLSFEQVLDIGRILERQLRRSEVAGAVVVQGTDNIEETSFAWDLLPLPDKPVVVVGAMRSASQDGYDGPENLRNAIAAAASEGLRGQGVLAVMDGEIHGADQVRKVNSHSYGTFQSPNVGPVGYVRAGEVVALRYRSVRHTLSRIPERASLPIPIVTALLDQDEDSTRAQLEGAAGAVFEATGSGNTHPMLLALARECLARDVPVVVTTRAPSGRATPGYGFPGGSTMWWETGAIFAGFVGGWKARVALALGIGVGLSMDELADLFTAFGGGRGRGPGGGRHVMTRPRESSA